MPLFIIAFFAIFAALLSPAWADDHFSACDAPSDIPVTVTPRFDEPVYNYTRSIRELSARSANAQTSIREKLTLGLTEYKPMINIQAELMTITEPNGLVCSHIDKVDVTVGFQDVVVSIADEIPEGTCGFAEVMGHEQKHIAVNREILAEYAPRIADTIQNYLRQNGIRREDNKDYAAQMMHEQMQDIVHQFMTSMQADNDERQSHIDTPQEYLRVSSSCNGELRGITRRAVMGR